jgi:hypothetical protein
MFPNTPSGIDIEIMLRATNTSACFWNNSADAVRCFKSMAIKQQQLVLNRFNKNSA